jgi:trans-2-enoyl-CoA reductase
MQVENQIVKKNETALKDIIVDFVGNKINPENDEVTIQHIAQVFSEEFPELVIIMAEENWINGYTQALNDVDFVKNQRKKNESEKHHKE